MENLKYFTWSFMVSLLGAVAALMIGGPKALFLVAVLCVLEVSLSFDNAVVNATVLKDMTEIWKRRFLTWGMLIAVFGMRIVFPVLIVSVVAGITPWDALDMALNNERMYAKTMESAHISVMAFGGAFLIMVGLEFFFDDEKEHHWIDIVEASMLKLSSIPLIAEMVTCALLLSVALFSLEAKDAQDFLVAGLSGVLIFTAIKKLGGYMEEKEAARAAVEAGTKSGLAAFIYLEILDASFSFDGVIGAFAISTNLFIIAIGLGVGAMFVRSLTIMLVEKDTLAEYAYLEHGAFYAIVVLALIMFTKTFYHVPEVVTGLLGAGFIAIAFAHSLHENKKEKARDDSSATESVAGSDIVTAEE